MHQHFMTIWKVFISSLSTTCRKPLIRLGDEFLILHRRWRTHARPQAFRKALAQRRQRMPFERQSSAQMTVGIAGA
jgi:hypothetical protein